MNTSAIRYGLLTWALISAGGCRLGPEPARDPEDRPPLIEIDLDEGEMLYAGLPSWEFVAFVSDPEGADPGDIVVALRLVRESGELVAEAYPVPDATGRVALEVSFLEEDSYALLVDAEDPHGLTAEAEVSFSVGNVHPAVTIEAPLQNAMVDQYQALTISALITDVDNPPESPLQGRLEDVSGAQLDSHLTDEQGRVVFEYVPETAGTQFLVVVGVDELGAEGRQTLELDVRPCGDYDEDGFWSCSTEEGAAVDCDDDDPLINPDAEEICDQKDTDCDGVMLGEEEDGDGDGIAPCAGDCDDAHAAVFPGADEVCDGLDDDCDGSLPEWEVDADQDGYRPCDTGTLAADCDDSNATIHPGAEEVCDGADSDCDGEMDASETDADADGYPLCLNDCDDADPYTWPGAIERLDFKDNDCDGLSEGGVVGLEAANARFDGIQADALTGAALSAGDLNGDHIDDWAIGAPGYNSSGGSTDWGGVFIVFGFDGIWALEEGVGLESGILVSEDESAAEAGAALAIVDDLDGDRFDDLVIGSPGWSEGGFSDAGQVSIVSGRVDWTSGSLADLALTRIDGSSGGMRLGTALSSSIDLTGDGVTDVLIGAPWTSRRPTSPGFVAVLSARTGWAARTSLSALARITGEESQALGMSLAVGRISGDGIGDFVSGAYLDVDREFGMFWAAEGSAAIRPGNTTSIAALNSDHYDGDDEGELVGAYVASGADIDRDGYDDILVGRYDEGFEGDGDNPPDAAAYLFFGGDLPAGGWIEEEADVRFLLSGSDECPCAVVALPDWNGDGFGDFALSASRANEGGTDSGSVYLFLGRPAHSWPSELSLADADGILVGDDPGGQAGRSLAAGDLDGDGLSDLLIGAPYADGLTPDGELIPRAGRVYLVLGTAS